MALLLKVLLVRAQLVLPAQPLAHHRGEQRGAQRLARLGPQHLRQLGATDDGLLSVPCMEVVAHRHAQFVLDHTFAGNYPGSPCSIRVDTSLLMIIVQSFFFFVPGTLVEVMPPTMGRHADLGGVAVSEAGHSTAEWDLDLIKHIGTSGDDVLHAGLAHIRQQQLNLEAEASVWVDQTDCGVASRLAARVRAMAEGGSQPCRLAPWGLVLGAFTV